MNDQCNYLPCFVETYGLYYYKDDIVWKMLKKKRSTDGNELISSLELQEAASIDYARACQDSRRALLQQYAGSERLSFYVANGSRDYTSYQMIYQLPYLLYQVYFALAQIQTQFTHYDLHTSNVMVYRPEKGKFIEYVYHISDTEEVRFRCPYLVKIIDYGRCFFKWNTKGSHVSSTDVYQHLCEEVNCTCKEEGEMKRKCFHRNGFSFLDNPALAARGKYFISSSRSNVSHDLRLLHIVSQKLTQCEAHRLNIETRSTREKNVSEKMHNLLSKVVYAVGLGDKEISQAGTIENRHSGYPNHINNVSDAEEALRELINDEELVQLNKFKYPDERKPDICLGTLHVYTNGRSMLFER
jgi:hypothetical protein